MKRLTLPLLTLLLTALSFAQINSDVVSIGVQTQVDETTGREICHHAMLSISNSASIAFASVEGEPPAFVLARLTPNPDELIFTGNTDNTLITFQYPDGSTTITQPTSAMIEDSVPGMLMDAAELLNPELVHELLNTHGDVTITFHNNNKTATITITSSMLDQARTGFATQCLPE